MKNKKAKVAVIGAGPAGLTTAYEMVKRGIEVHLFERAPFTGGLSRSVECWNENVDAGPHAFYENSYPEALDFWKSINGEKQERTVPNKGVLFRGKILRYPFRPLDMLLKTGPFPLLQLAFGWLFRKRNSETHNAKDLVVSKYGKGLLDLFFRPYCQKYFGRNPEEIDVSFAQLLYGYREGYGTASAPKEQPALLYPSRGTGQTWEIVTEKLLKAGVEISTGAEIEKLLLHNGKLEGLQLKDGTSFSFDAVVSTIPPGKLIQLVEPVGVELKFFAAKLEFRHTLLVYFRIPAPLENQYHYITCYDTDFQFGRITDFRCWAPQRWKNSDNTILCVEYWCDDNSSTWQMTDEQLADFAGEELMKAGICKSKPAESKLMRLKNSYPLLEAGYEKYLSGLQEYFSKIDGLEIIGRHGRFSWDGQEDAILSGIRLAEKLARRFAE